MCLLINGKVFVLRGNKTGRVEEQLSMLLSPDIYFDNWCTVSEPQEHTFNVMNLLMSCPLGFVSF